MSDKDRHAPEPEEDKAVLVRDEDGHARLVPGGNIVEGERLPEEIVPEYPPQREAMGKGTTRSVVEE